MQNAVPSMTLVIYKMLFDLVLPFGISCYCLQTAPEVTMGP